MYAKWTLYLIIGAVLGVLLCIAYCALVVASRADDIQEQKEKEDERE